MLSNKFTTIYQTAPAIEMPETVKTAMHKAVTVIWDAASSLAGDEIDRIRKEAGKETHNTCTNARSLYFESMQNRGG